MLMLNETSESEIELDGLSTCFQDIHFITTPSHQPCSGIVYILHLYVYV